MALKWFQALADTRGVFVTHPSSVESYDEVQKNHQSALERAVPNPLVLAEGKAVGVAPQLRYTPHALLDVTTSSIDDPDEFSRAILTVPFLAQVYRLGHRIAQRGPGRPESSWTARFSEEPPPDLAEYRRAVVEAVGCSFCHAAPTQSCTYYNDRSLVDRSRLVEIPYVHDDRSLAFAKHIAALQED